MAKMIHSMIRVFDLDRSIKFYAQALQLKVKQRCDFDDFSLVYLTNQESTFELELTYNTNRDTPYSHGSGYGHLAVTVSDINTTHAALLVAGLTPGEVKTFHHQGEVLATFFFISDPDGYQIEFIERAGRYQ
ncbi:VOC family protein [Edwardsiella anguillarum]|uniref:VOC family protein n=1 Tax=Edwardsiella anguillarum TaxID=1821960 RepID=UPI0024B6D7D6|nr:VOC family protein [Edwardsiella anguillarum]WHP81788.1 VOC family protein [Edwardsiella anguillarum]WHQ19291.1 VOC family protein [Edwardsiella anguillarum]WHQ22835.1 VOC family protein [Edwardsiella anguillarum]WHQ26360.1 VOC family protein [Edwardsiella anguillarum]WHQ29874.1 VOC family protein [Edwardsiella anguillarum]